jgi:CBS domain-containing protein
MDLLKVATVPPVMATPTTTVFDVIWAMAEHGASAVVVVDERRHPVGIFTERDNLLRVTLQRRDMEETAIAEVMTSPVDAVYPETSVKDALACMVRNHFHHLPIVDAQNRLVGIVSARSLLLRRLGEKSADLEAMSVFVSVDAIGVGGVLPADAVPAYQNVAIADPGFIPAAESGMTECVGFGIMPGEKFLLRAEIPEAEQAEDQTAWRETADCSAVRGILDV